MKSFKFYKKGVFFSAISNNIIFGADKPKDDWIVLTKDNIEYVNFSQQIDGKLIYNSCSDFNIKLERIPNFLSNYLKKIIDDFSKLKKGEFILSENCYRMYLWKYINIEYNVISEGECIKTIKQDPYFGENKGYRILQEIVFPKVLTDKEMHIGKVNFLDIDFYDNILNKNYFKEVKFKDGTLSINVDLQDLLKIIKRGFYYSKGVNKKGDYINVPFIFYDESFKDADIKFSKKNFSQSEGFSEFYNRRIYDYNEMSRLEKYFNFKTMSGIESTLDGYGKFTIWFKETITDVNCKLSCRYSGTLYPDLYYFYSNIIDGFGEIDHSLKKRKDVFKDYTTEDTYKKLLKEETLFHFYKVIESIDLNKIEEYSMFFQNIVHFIKDYVIPYEEELLFNELNKIEFKEYLKATETNAEEFFYNKALEIIKRKDSVFKDFYTLFFYDETKNKIKGVYFDDLSKKDELKLDLVKLFSLKKLIDEFQNKYIEIDEKVNKSLEDDYGMIDISKPLKEQFIGMIKKSKIIEDNIVEDFLKTKNFSILISKYIIWYCKENYKEQFESKDKATLKSFIEKLNKKEDLFNEIKTKTKALKIEEKYYTYFDNNELERLISDMKDHSLKSLFNIFVDEIITNEKEEIDKISDDVKKLKEKIKYYSKKDDSKLSNIVTLLDDKLKSENMNNVKFNIGDMNNVLLRLNMCINEKLKDKKDIIITTFVKEQIADIKELKDLTRYNEYLGKFNKNKDEYGSIKQLLKNKLNTEGFEGVDIKDDDYNLADLQNAISDKKTELDNLLAAKLAEEDKGKLTNIKNEIKKIVNNIINSIKAINSKDSLKKCVYKDDVSITNNINNELVKLKLDHYDEFIKKEISGSDSKQTFGDIIDSEIKTNVTKILVEYKKIEDLLCVVNIKYTLNDEDKITTQGKLEFKKLTDEKYKKFDSRKTYKELFGTLKSVSAYFKNIDLVDSSTLISIENKDEVIDKDNITINIKLVDSCYKKEEPKGPKDDDPNEHKDDDHNDPKDNEDKGGNNSGIDESVDSQIKGNNRGCKCCNNKNKNSKNKNNNNNKSNKKTCCAKKV